MSHSPAPPSPIPRSPSSYSRLPSDTQYNVGRRLDADKLKSLGIGVSRRLGGEKAKSQPPPDFQSLAAAAHDLDKRAKKAQAELDDAYDQVYAQAQAYALANAKLESHAAADAQFAQAFAIAQALNDAKAELDDAKADCLAKSQDCLEPILAQSEVVGEVTFAQAEANRAAYFKGQCEIEAGNAQIVAKTKAYAKAKAKFTEYFATAANAATAPKEHFTEYFATAEAFSNAKVELAAKGRAFGKAQAAAAAARAKLQSHAAACQDIEIMGTAEAAAAPAKAKFQSHAAACQDIQIMETAQASVADAMSPSDADASFRCLFPMSDALFWLITKKALEIEETPDVPDSIKEELARMRQAIELGRMTGVPDDIRQEFARTRKGVEIPDMFSQHTGGVWFAIMVVLLTFILLVHFQEKPMTQVWVLSLMMCSSIFLFPLLMSISRTRRLVLDFVQLSYAPIIAFSFATVVGSLAATFILFFGIIWAAGNLGHSLALHHLRKGTEPAIHALSSIPSKFTIQELNLILDYGVPFVVLLWALVMMLIVYALTPADELLILAILSYFGWLHALFWVIFVEMVPMRAVPLGKWMNRLLPALVPSMVVLPLLCIVSEILSVLCHLLLMMTLVAYLWYDLAVYKHFLATAAPSITTPGNEDTLHSDILGDKTGQMHFSETATPSITILGNEDTLHFDILGDKARQMKGILEETPSEVAATLLLSSEVATASEVEDMTQDPCIEVED